MLVTIQIDTNDSEQVKEAIKALYHLIKTKTESETVTAEKPEVQLVIPKLANEDGEPLATPAQRNFLRTYSTDHDIRARIELLTKKEAYTIIREMKTEESKQFQASLLPEENIEPVKKGRGRPRKNV